MQRGKLIQAPCGSGKTRWISALPVEKKSTWVDGDELLERHSMKNRNYFWYNNACSVQRAVINGLFEEHLAKGINILYSGHPELMSTDVIVLIDENTRWERLQSRAKDGGFAPSREQFDNEEKIYSEAAKSGKYQVIKGGMKFLNVS